MNEDQLAEFEGARLAVALLASWAFAATGAERTEILVKVVWELQSAKHGDAVAVGFSRALSTGLDIAMADHVHVRDGTPGSVSFSVSSQRESSLRKNASQAVQSLKKGRKRGGR